MLKMDIGMALKYIFELILFLYSVKVIHVTSQSMEMPVMWLRSTCLWLRFFFYFSD